MNAAETDGQINETESQIVSMPQEFVYTDSLLTVSFTDSSTNATTWLWDFGDGNTSNLQSPSNSYSGTGTYYVCLTSSNGCNSDTICDSISVLISNVEYNQIIIQSNIYPNPFNNFATLIFNKNLNGIYDILVYDLVGREALRINNVIGNKLEINKKNTGKGLFLIYLVNNKTGEEIFLEKLVAH